MKTTAMTTELIEILKLPDRGDAPKSPHRLFSGYTARDSLVESK